MKRFLTVLTVAGAAAIAAQTMPTAAAAEQVIVIDAPDVQKLNSSAGGFRTSDVIGTDVYSNTGKRIGEVEDFAFSRGYLYAVVDIQKGPIERYVDLGDDDMVVIPWNQLRVRNRAE